jgi:hypothetical protein
MVEVPPQQAEVNAEFARRLYDRVAAWYESAERKAQLILTLTGLFISFLTASVLRKPADLRATTERFGPETWALFALMSISLLSAVLCAVLCLRSRVYKDAELRSELARGGVRPEDPSTIGPEFVWFFQHIAGLAPAALGRRLQGVDLLGEANILAVNVVPLARNVVAKHRWVNRGFALVGLTLVSFFCAGVSYAIRVA